MWNPTNVTAFGLVALVLLQEHFQEHYQQQRKFILIVRSRYANVVTTLNQVLGVEIQKRCLQEVLYLGKEVSFLQE
jgi:hypothetical protein